MDKQTKQLLLIAGGLYLLYYFKNRPQTTTPADVPEDTAQDDYYGGGMYTGGVPVSAGGAGFVPSGDDDTDSLANDPTEPFTGSVVKPGSYVAPIVGGKGDGVSGRPVIGNVDTQTRLPSGASTTPSGGTSFYGRR